jgi:hypothetical protein
MLPVPAYDEDAELNAMFAEFDVPITAPVGADVVANTPTQATAHPYADWLLLADEFSSAFSPLELIDELAKVCDPIDSARSLNDDPQARAAMMGVHLAMNRHRTIAPWFRKFHGERLRKSGRDGNALSKAECQLNNDLQLIDFHWVIQKRLAVHPDSCIDIGSTRVCDDGNINWIVLIEFVQSRATKAKRLAALGLDEIDQCEMIKLHTKPVKDRKDNAKYAKSEVIQALLVHVGKAKSRITADQVPRWAAEWEALKLASGSPTGALRILPSIVGGPVDMDAASMRDRKRKLRAALGPSLCHGW